MSSPYSPPKYGQIDGSLDLDRAHRPGLEAPQHLGRHGGRGIGQGAVIAAIVGAVSLAATIIVVISNLATAP